MSQSSRAIDKAGAHHWDSRWRNAALPKLVVPGDMSLRNHVRRCLHAFLVSALEGRRGSRLIEVGCANSIWLPYFAQQHECSITGLDYSEIGCASARAILADTDLKGEVYLADLWNPPGELVGAFDLVFTYGLAEHFDPTDHVLATLSSLLKPEGKMITIVPNLSGWAGKLQRLLNRPVFDIHVPMDLAALGAAHEKAGLKVRQAGYLCSVNFGIINLDGTSDGMVLSVVKRLFTKILIGFSVLIWWIEDHSPLRLRPNRLTSPYIACVAVKGSNSARQLIE